MASINPQNLDVTPSLAADDRVMTTNKDGITKTIMGSTLLEFFAEGTTADAPGGAQNKVITLTDFEGSVLPAQFKINITFTEGNTFGDTTASTPTYPRIILKNKSGAALGTFDVCDSRGHAAGTGCWNNNDFISFKRYGSKLIITNSDVRQAVTSSTNGYTIYSDGTKVYPTEHFDVNKFVQPITFTDTMTFKSAGIWLGISSTSGLGTGACAVLVCRNSTGSSKSMHVVGGSSSPTATWTGNDTLTLKINGVALPTSWIQITNKYWYS